MKTLTVVFLFFVSSVFAVQSTPVQSMTNAAVDPRWKTMPYPAQVEVSDGHFSVGQNFRVQLNGHTESRLDRAVERFLIQLSKQTGMVIGGANPAPTKDPSVQQTGADPALIITTAQASKKIQEPGEDESYTLEITPSGIKLDAADPLGVLRGLETILQAVEPGPDGFSIPAAKIQDKPRFPWRGLLIDSCRHWMPLDVILRNLDGMAAVKMNVLHWHLSENQGFRVESKKYPRLQGLGSDGNYYTQAEIREVVEYAHDRGIRVVPEFDMPGHSTSWLVGYPEIASGPGPFELDRRWGVFDPSMDPTNEKTYKFLAGFISEMSALFPDPYFHIGGDEVNGKQWNANEKIQKYMHDHGMKDNHDLQAYFNQRVQKIVEKNGKTMMGWDEVLHPELPKQTVVQSWRGQKSLADAAKQGYRGLLSNGLYLDLAEPAWQHYAVDPMSGEAAGLTDDEKARILGGESCMWAEYISPETIDSRIWPRNAAIAERLWSPQDVRDVESMYMRLARVSAWLTFVGLQHESNYLPMLQRMAGADGAPWLKQIADYVEPVKGYRRGRAQKYTQQTPLNRLVDVARPESMPALKFARRVERIVQGTGSAEDESVVRALLNAWHALPEQAVTSGGNDFLTQEAVPVAKQFGILADMGLQALNALKSGEKLTDDWRKEQSVKLEEAKKPVNEVLVVAAPAIERLVMATGK